MPGDLSRTRERVSHSKRAPVRPKCFTSTARCLAATTERGRLRSDEGNLKPLENVAQIAGAPGPDRPLAVLTAIAAELDIKSKLTHYPGDDRILPSSEIEKGRACSTLIRIGSCGN